MIEKIKHWAQVFNLPVKTEKHLPALREQKFCVSLIDEELKELHEGILNQDITEIQDALGDLLWVTVRAMQTYGFNPEETIDAIYDSNMSKLDYSKEDALKTREKYSEQGMITYMEQKMHKGIDIFITHRSTDGKVMKSLNFQEPKF